MPSGSKSTVINRNTYTYEMQPLSAATEILAAFTRLVSDPAVALASSLKTDNLADMDLKELPKIIQAIVGPLLSKVGDAQQLLAFVSLLNAGGKVKGPNPKAEAQSLMEIGEEHFRDNLRDLVPWIAFAVRCQLGPFGASILSALGLDAAGAGALKDLAQKASEFMSRSASKSDGQSSDSSSSALQA